MPMFDWLAAAAAHPVTLLSVGGAAGTNARYWLGELVRTWQLQRPDVVPFPWATLAINVSGSVFLGLFAGMYLGHPDPGNRRWYLLLGTGFCGGYTTFSTFSLETLGLLRADRPLAAAGYVVGSVAGGLVGVWAAMRAVGK